MTNAIMRGSVTGGLERYRSEFWIAPDSLILASRSSARSRLLAATGIPFEVEVADIDERAFDSRLHSLSPDQIAAALASEKALAVSKRLPDRVVLGADQIMEFRGSILHKAESAPELRDRLRSLSGTRHALHSAFALAVGGRLAVVRVDKARIAFREISDAFIDRYIAAVGSTGFDSAGGYEIEGLGLHLIHTSEGDYATILGLPMSLLLFELRRLGFLLA